MVDAEKARPAESEPYRSDLAEFENETSTRPPFFLTFAEVKLLGIAGVRKSFLTINPLAVSEMPLLLGWFLP
jgi:hypothetical protein